MVISGQEDNPRSIMMEICGQEDNPRSINHGLKAVVDTYLKHMYDQSDIVTALTPWLIEISGQGRVSQRSVNHGLKAVVDRISKAYV